MSIIEKLRITPGPDKIETYGDILELYDSLQMERPRISENNLFHDARLLLKLKTERTQLLEALIEITIEDDENFLPGTLLRVGIDKRIALIESATPKSWEEIKVLMEDEG